MGLMNWFGGIFTGRGKALVSYRRGMERAKNGDQQGAIDDYTDAIRSGETPPDIKAMALYNRSMVYTATGDNPKAILDLNAVLAMNETLDSIKTEARRKLVRMQRRSDRDGPSP